MFSLNCGGKLKVFDKPIVMGIINTTPDSFYADSRKASIDEALYTAEKMLHDGAAMLDIGGQSTRPGSEKISAEEEMKRVIPIIQSVHDHFPEAIISADTFYASVAREAIMAGAAIINDISGGQADTNMLQTVAALHAVYICMHIKGTPQNMKQYASYDNVIEETIDYFVEHIAACTSAGIHDIIIDPGFGFAKTAAHNFQILANLKAYRILAKPVLAGISRKSFIYKTLDVTSQDALNGTTALHAVALLHGANILRVHDVKEACEAVKLISALPVS